MNNLILDSLSMDNEPFSADSELLMKSSQLNLIASDSKIAYELRSKYKNGCMQIQDTNGIIYNPDGSLYLNFKLEIKEDLVLGEQLRNVPKFMSTVWKMKSPQIIIPIITGVKNFKNWKNQKLEEQFRRGIIKAANKTEMWIITSGINGGLPAMIGDAFNEENSSRITTSSNRDNNETLKDLSFIDTNETQLKPLTLIGIVSASSLQNYSSFDGQVRKFFSYLI